MGTFVLTLAFTPFLLLWGWAWFILWFMYKSYKTKYHLGLGWARHHGIRRYQCQSKEVWEHSFEMLEKLALKLCKFFSPLYLVTAIVGIFIGKMFPYFWIVESIVFFSGAIYYIFGEYRIAKSFGVKSFFQSIRQLTILTNDIPDWKED